MDWHEMWRRRLGRDPGGGAGELDAPGSEAGRIRYLHVVARTRMDLFLTLRRQFRDDPSVHVMLDRRERDRRRQARPVAFADRRQAPDRRRPKEYWEDIAHHPAVIIPLDPPQPQHDDAPASDPPAQDRDAPGATSDPVVTPERLRAWVEESRHVVQHLFPAVLRERDEARARLEETTRRCGDLQAERDALRAEVARLAAAHRQLEQDHAEITRGLGRSLARISGALEPLRELQQRVPRPADPTAIPAPAGDETEPTGRGRILIADSEPVAAAALRDALARLGHSVKIAVGGREALGLVPAFEPDVVLLDVAVPDPPGPEMLDQLRRLDPALPVVVVSTAQHEQDALGLLARGAFDCLSKPFTLDVAARVVAGAIAHRRS